MGSKETWYSCTYFATPAVSFITNSTKLVRGAKIAHTTIACAAEYIEDSANLAYLPFDIILFGQPVPIGKEGRFNVFGEV